MAKVRRRRTGRPRRTGPRGCRPSAAQGLVGGHRRGRSRRHLRRRPDRPTRLQPAHSGGARAGPELRQPAPGHRGTAGCDPDRGRPFRRGEPGAAARPQRAAIRRGGAATPTASSPLPTSSSSCSRWPTRSPPKQNRAEQFHAPLPRDKLATYDAIADRASASDVLGQNVLGDIARRLVAMMRAESRQTGPSATTSAPR